MGWSEHMEDVIRPGVEGWAADKTKAGAAEELSRAGVDSGAGARDTSVAATVVDVVYLGSVAQLIVELRTGERLMVHRLNDEVGASDPRPGDSPICHVTLDSTPFPRRRPLRAAEKETWRKNIGF